MNKKKNQISGTIEKIRFQQDSFVIGDFRNNAKSLSLLSIFMNMINQQVGMDYKLTGKLYDDPVHK